MLLLVLYIHYIISIDLMNFSNVDTKNKIKMLYLPKNFLDSSDNFVFVSGYNLFNWRFTKSLNIKSLRISLFIIFFNVVKLFRILNFGCEIFFRDLTLPKISLTNMKKDKLQVSGRFLLNFKGSLFSEIFTRHFHGPSH